MRGCSCILDNSSEFVDDSIKFFIIYVPNQQLQGQLQTQHIVDTGNYMKDKHNVKILWSKWKRWALYLITYIINRFNNVINEIIKFNYLRADSTVKGHLHNNTIIILITINQFLFICVPIIIWGTVVTTMTNSMEQHPSCEVISRSASQEIHRLL
jgi:hypothetical protein